ncbi:MAG: peptide deformylase [Pseudomonadota bacterium]|jgi:peptide deformylase
MAILPILHYPNPRLHLKAKTVDKFDAELHQLINDMRETMYESNGIGLAATQVNVQKRLFIADLAKDGAPSQFKVFINLKIIEKSGEHCGEEGCLSVPGIYETVTRASWVKVEYQDEYGNSHTLECDGLLAICIQHENDHLDGKVFVDYLSGLKQNYIRKKMKKIFKNEQ